MNPKIESIPPQKVLVFLNGEERMLDLPMILEKLGVTSVIRIPETEYDNIEVDEQGYLTHFNLKSTNHEIGQRYSLPKIIRNGSVTESGKIPPLLSFKDTYIAECIEVDNNIPYDNLDSESFNHSMRGITNIDSLKATMLRRYGPSRPNLSAD